MHYLATIKVLVEAETQAEANDLLSETLRPAVVDWAYLCPRTPLSNFVEDYLTSAWRTFFIPVEIDVENYKKDDLMDIRG